jgi:hypothetical protein
MVHPNVLRNCGLDPDEYQVFAWGLGNIDRIAMLKYGMPDLRAFLTPTCAGYPTTAFGRSISEPRRRAQRVMKFTWRGSGASRDRCPVRDDRRQAHHDRARGGKVVDRGKLLHRFPSQGPFRRAAPNAMDRLRVCMVDTGTGDAVQVVCGA